MVLFVMAIMPMTYDFVWRWLTGQDIEMLNWIAVPMNQGRGSICLTVNQPPMPSKTSQIKL